MRAPFNKIVTIPPEIGRLKRLKKLILNSNRIAILPEEVGRLEGLEELVLSENEIELLPKTISMMAALRVLKLQNNKLKKLPNEIAEVLTLEEIDCTNNKKLEMIPPNWRGDTESILFICRIHRGELFPDDFSLDLTQIFLPEINRVCYQNGRNGDG